MITANEDLKVKRNNVWKTLFDQLIITSQEAIHSVFFFYFPVGHYPDIQLKIFKMYLSNMLDWIIASQALYGCYHCYVV